MTRDNGPVVAREAHTVPRCVRHSAPDAPPHTCSQSMRVMQHSTAQRSASAERAQGPPAAFLAGDALHAQHSTARSRTEHSTAQEHHADTQNTRQRSTRTCSARPKSASSMSRRGGMSPCVERAPQGRRACRAAREADDGQATAGGARGAIAVGRRREGEAPQKRADAAALLPAHRREDRQPISQPQRPSKQSTNQ